MNLPCETCLVLARCKQLICPNPPRFVPSTKIIRYLLTEKLETSIKCPMLREYCSEGGYDDNGVLVNIYKVTSFFETPYGEPYL